MKRPVLAILAACLALAACGGPRDQQDGPGDGRGDGTQASDAAGGAANGGEGASGGSADGPITASMESGTYAYTVGRCDIIDEVVYLNALAENRAGQVEAILPPWDRELAYAQRDGHVRFSNYGADASEQFELVADRSDAGTTWEWTVSGSSVEVTARMGNLTTATRESGVPQFTEYRDVTIEIECGGGVFGSGMDAELFAAEEVYPIQPSVTRAPGQVTIDLEGTTYEITYLSHCVFFSEDVSAEGIANEASVYLYSEGRGVHLDLLVGDRRAEEEGMRWSLLPEAELQDDFLFDGSDTSRSWSGTIVSAGGTRADATITVECTEGDAFEAAGTASVVLDGVTHVLDEVTTCTIDGTTIDFFGHSTDTGVAIVVTGGGTQIALGDESGAQTLTSGVQFDISGQQADWTGVLAGDRQATVAIDCG